MKHEDTTILIVDDVELNRLILRNILEEDYQIIEAKDGYEALKILFEDKILPTAVLLDIMMPGIDGFHVLEQIKLHKETKAIPVLFITAADTAEDESRGLKAGAADYVTKPFNIDIVRARVDNHVSLARYQHGLEQLVEIKTAEVTKTYEQTLEVLATIIEYRNLESSEHIRRTTLLAEAVITRMLTVEKFMTTLQNSNIRSMIKASALHDIGKIGIADSILLKPGKLTNEEFDVVKKHTTIGADIIDRIAATMPDNDMYLKHARDICLYHHEKWNGGGYPTGCSGEDIPLSARVIALVDVYDALVSQRCYKEAFSHEKSLEIIYEGRGTHFDPDIVDIIPDISSQLRYIEEHYR